MPSDHFAACLSLRPILSLRTEYCLGSRGLTLIFISNQTPQCPRQRDTPALGEVVEHGTRSRNACGPSRTPRPAAQPSRCARAETPKRCPYPARRAATGGYPLSWRSQRPVQPFSDDLVNGIGQFRFVRKHAEEGIAWPYAYPSAAASASWPLARARPPQTSGCHCRAPASWLPPACVGAYCIRPRCHRHA
jgi:hypothetical protein